MAIQFNQFTTYYTPLQLAHVLGLHRRTIYRALREGHLEGLRCGKGRLWKIPKEAINAWAG